MNDPRLYILMRTDMDSMNAGKGMAQAAHAANAMDNHYEDVKMEGLVNPNWSAPSWFKPYRAWKIMTPQGFGTTITLEAETEAAMKSTVDVAFEMGYAAGVVHDPTYPVCDGLVTHLIPVDTCAYVFSPDGAPWFLSNFNLHP